VVGLETHVVSTASPPIQEDYKWLSVGHWNLLAESGSGASPLNAKCSWLLLKTGKYAISS